MKLTPIKLAMCLSVLIHVGILSAYYAFWQVPRVERVEFNQERPLEIDIIRDPGLDAPDAPAPQAVKAPEVPKMLPPSPPRPPVTEIEPATLVAATVLPAAKDQPLEAASARQLDAAAVEAKAGPPANRALGTGLSSAAVASGVPANYLLNPEPVYPIEARRRRQEGLVVLAVQVNREGFPDWVQVVQSSGFQLLDEAAARAVKHWQFSPARLGALAVASQIEVPIRFKLTGAN